MKLADIDLLDRDRFTEGIPHEWFTFLRHEAPVYKHPEPGGRGFWVVTKHDDVVAVGRDASTYSSAQDRGGVVALEDPTPEMLAAMGEDGGPAAMAEGNMMLMMDPPAHTRYRLLVNKGFTPRMISALEPHIQALARQVVDNVIERGECDFVVDVAAELPLLVITEMLGVPVEDRHKVFEWSNRMIGSEDPEYQVGAEAVSAAQIEMFMYADALRQQRQQEARDDIVTELLQAEMDGDKLTELDFDLFFLLLAVAGNETTRNAIAHGMNALLENPDQFELLVDDPALARTTATEEILRWASPVMYFRRNVTQDTELRGQRIPAGDKVSIWYVSANRDEEVFEDPFRFDIRRDPNEHVAFGGGGPHFCLGSNLARMEIRLLFEEIAQRIPEMRLAGKPDPLRSNFIGGIKHLPVTFPPGSRRVETAGHQ